MCFATNRDYRNFLVRMEKTGGSQRETELSGNMCVCVCALLAYILYLLDAETIRFFFFEQCTMEQEEGDQHIQPELPGGASITPRASNISGRSH